ILCQVAGQPDLERRAARLAVVRANGPAVQDGEVLRDGQAEARPPLRAAPVDPIKTMEDALELRGRDSGPLIGDAHDALAALARQYDAHLPAAMPRRVVEQVGEDLVRAYLVDRREDVAALERETVVVAELAQDVAQVRAAEVQGDPSRLDLIEIRHVAHEPLDAGDLPLHHVAQLLFLRGGEIALLEGLGSGAESRERSP